MAPPGLSAEALSIAPGIPAPRPPEILHEKRGVTPGTATRLARSFGAGNEMGGNFLAQYEACLLEREKGQEFMRIIPHRAVQASLQ